MGITPHPILLTRFQISVHSIDKQFLIFKQQRDAAAPARDCDVRPSTWSRDGCGLRSLPSCHPRRRGWGSAPCEKLWHRAAALPCHFRLKNAVVTTPLSLLSLDHKLTISRQSKSQHTLKNFPVAPVIFFAFFFFFFFFCRRGEAWENRRGFQQTEAAVHVWMLGRRNGPQ